MLQLRLRLRSRSCGLFLPPLLLLLAAAAAGAAQASGAGGEAEGNSREVLETQHAVCEVSTEELVAKAQATVTRVLKGLCNAKEMDERFRGLEAQLGEQLNVIKTMILNMDDRLQEQDFAARRSHRRLLGALQRGCPGPAPSVSRGPGSAALRSAWQAPAPEPDEALDSGEATAAAAEAPRGSEVLRYNSSIHTVEGGRRAFTYYWRVPHVAHKMAAWDSERSVRSPSFYVFQGGYRMYLKLFPRRTPDSMFVHAGLAPGAFDAQLQWPFALSLRVSVLEQAAAAAAVEDVSSRLWQPADLCSSFNWQRPLAGDSRECVGLGFPHGVVRSRGFLWRDSLLIKLAVYLN